MPTEEKKKKFDLNDLLIIYDKSSDKNIIMENTTDLRYDKYNVTDSINMSSELTFLIHETGRWNERWGSDLFISWNSYLKKINQICDQIHTEDTAEFIDVFGIRVDGVDHDTYIVENMNNTIGRTDYLGQYYRKVYAIKTTIYKDEENWLKITITIKNITLDLPQYCYSKR